MEVSTFVSKGVRSMDSSSSSVMSWQVRIHCSDRVSPNGKNRVGDGAKS